VLAETMFRSLTLVLTALLVLAVAHKVQLLRSGRAGSQPLIKSHGLHGAGAAVALSLGAVVEVAVAAALVLAPQYGFPATAALFLLYAHDLRRLAPNETCGCFGEWLAAARRTQAIRRNLTLAGLAVIGGVAYQTEVVDAVAISQASAGATIVIVAIVLPLVMRRRVAQRPSVLT
jgi:hypothetical protein